MTLRMDRATRDAFPLTGMKTSFMGAHAADTALDSLIHSMLPLKTQPGEMNKALTFLIDKAIVPFEGSAPITDAKMLTRYVSRLPTARPDTGMLLMEVAHTGMEFLDAISDRYNQVLRQWTHKRLNPNQLMVRIPKSNGTELYYEAAQPNTAPPVQNIGYTFVDVEVSRVQAAAQMTLEGIRSMFGRAEWRARRLEAVEAACKYISMNIVRTLMACPDIYSIGLQTHDNNQNSLINNLETQRSFFACANQGREKFLTAIGYVTDTMSLRRKGRTFDSIILPKSALRSLDLETDMSHYKLQGQGDSYQQTRKITGLPDLEVVSVDTMFDENDVNIMTAPVVVPLHTAITYRGNNKGGRQKIRVVDFNSNSLTTIHKQTALFNSGCFSITAHENDYDEIMVNGVDPESRVDNCSFPAHLSFNEELAVESDAITSVHGKGTTGGGIVATATTTAGSSPATAKILNMKFKSEQETAKSSLYMKRLPMYHGEWFCADSDFKCQPTEAFRCFSDLTPKGQVCFRHVSDITKHAQRLCELRGLSFSTFSSYVANIAVIFGNMELLDKEFQRRVFTQSGVTFKEDKDSTSVTPDDPSYENIAYFDNWYNTLPPNVQVYLQTLFNEAYYEFIENMSQTQISAMQHSNIHILRKIARIRNKTLRILSLMVAFLPVQYMTFSVLERCGLPDFIDTVLYRHPEFSMNNSVVYKSGDATGTNYFQLPSYSEIRSQQTSLASANYVMFTCFAVTEERNVAVVPNIGIRDSNRGTGTRFVSEDPYDNGIDSVMLWSGDIRTTIIPAGMDILQHSVITTANQWKHAMGTIVDDMRKFGSIFKNTPTARKTIHPEDATPPEPDLDYAESERCTTFEWINDEWVKTGINVGRLSSLDDEHHSGRLSGYFGRARGATVSRLP